METVVDRVPLEGWRDRRTGGEGWGSSADPPKLLFEGSEEGANQYFLYMTHHLLLSVTSQLSSYSIDAILFACNACS
jgi:hypothetical protein